jgi:type IV pilus assembly protein PilB
VSKPDLVSALAEVSRIPYFDCTSVEVDAETLRLITTSMARNCCALPLEVVGNKLVVVMAEPQNLRFLDELGFKSGMQISPRMGLRSEVEAAIAINYASAESESAAAVAAAAASTVVSMKEIVLSAADTEMEFISSSWQERNVEAMREMQSELLQKSHTTPAVMLVASMIKAAAERRVREIHIELHSEDTAICFRVDGMRRECQRIRKPLQNSVASRIKILSDMDIAERRAPQDGRFLVQIGGRRIDLRVSTLPTPYGEKVVMRLLEGDAPLQDLAKLGFPRWMEERLRPMLLLPQGMILVTGPTGSGKRTTLNSSLLLIRRPSINIITVEDPVEFAVAGLNQVQVNVKAGLTFATCLRSILRQDPNVIMIVRNPRQGKRRNCLEGRTDRPPGAFHLAYQRQHFGCHAPAGSGRSTISNRHFTNRYHRATVDPASLRLLEIHSHHPGVGVATGASRNRGPSALPQLAQRLRNLRSYRL